MKLKIFFSVIILLFVASVVELFSFSAVEAATNHITAIVVTALAWVYIIVCVLMAIAIIVCVLALNGDDVDESDGRVYV